MRLTKSDHIALNAATVAKMTARQKRDYIADQMPVIHNYRALGWSFDDIAELYPMSSDNIRRKYRAWLKDTNQPDPKGLHT